MRTIPVDGLTVRLFEPDGAKPLAIVYTHLDGDSAQTVARLLAPRRITLAAVDGADWDADLTPWKAKRAFRRGSDFSGGADRHLRTLAERVIPAAEEGLPHTERVIAGYSLGGLFAVYSLFRTDAFRAAVSVSGSLWYDGFTEFMRKTPLAADASRTVAYLCVGERESAARDPRLAAVGARTAEAAEILEAKGAKTLTRISPGGHFDEPESRLASGIAAVGLLFLKKK